MCRTFDVRVLNVRFPIGCPRGETLGKNRGVSCLGCCFGNVFFLTMIVPEVLRFRYRMFLLRYRFLIEIFLYRNVSLWYYMCTALVY